MLGKRPRALQRTTSKLQIIPDADLVCSPITDHLHEKPKPLTPFVGPHRQVIGFNPISKDNDAVASPRSVLSNVGSSNLHVKSPRSGLDVLYSTPRPWEKQGSDGVGLSIVAALSTCEENPGNDETSNDLMIHTGVAVQGTPLTNQQPSSSHQTQRIPIALGPSRTSPPGHTQQHLDTRCRDEDMQDWFTCMAEYSRELTDKHKPTLVLGATVDTGLPGSIFSAISPASSCNEISCLLPAIDFLSSCFFCMRHLEPGKDIYMYRGDRAFCSVNCRYQQIVIDERKEKCSAAALKSGSTAPSASAKHPSRVLNASRAAVT
eukprot:c23368_g1_i3 orf=561-1517(+)